MKMPQHTMHSMNCVLNIKFFTLEKIFKLHIMVFIKVRKTQLKKGSKLCETFNSTSKMKLWLQSIDEKGCT